jgi:hypothetical protein
MTPGYFGLIEDMLDNQDFAGHSNHAWGLEYFHRVDLRKMCLKNIYNQRLILLINPILSLLLFTILKQSF